MEPDISTICNNAADYMAEHGHCRGELEDAEGKVCLAGAILRANKESYKGAKFGDWYLPTVHACGDYLGQDAVIWNDYFASSGDAVEQLLRDVATKHRPDAMNG